MRRTKKMRALLPTESEKRIDAGWIPPDERTVSQRRLQETYERHLVPFGQVVTPLAELPKRALLFDLEMKTLGELLPRVWQSTGSCVGAAAAYAYAQTMCGDVHHRGDNETIMLPFPYITYGVGRSYSFRRKGDGSFGAQQAKAVNQFGMLAMNHPRMPKPSIRNGWAKWSSAVEYSWSHPSAWPIKYNEIAPDAKKHTIESIVRITSSDQAKQLVAQGYGITLASMFGTRPRVRNGLLVGAWNGSWAHQMNCGGYWAADAEDRPDRGSNGDLWLIYNQWGPNGHNVNCPYLTSKGIYGAFWIEDATWRRIIRNGEVIAHSNTNGFPGRNIDWGRMGYPTTAA